MEILFENPIILIVLLGIISSLFKKAKGDQTETPRTRQQKPRKQDRTREELSNLEASMEKAMKEEKRQQAERARRLEEDYRQRKQQAEESMRALESLGNETERKVQTLREPAAKPVERLQTQKQTLGQFRPHKQALIDGFIWSEILGPPRAKNPHRSTKRK